MLEELRNLEVQDWSSEMRKLKDQNPRLRVISSRWVCARKNPEKVRSRIVAKDLATGSARKQGFSSPTPSHDALMIAFGDLQDRVSVRLQTMVEDHVEETETCESLVSTKVLSDSQAGLDVIAAEDVPRRSRHIEIRLAWLRLQVESGRLSFRWGQR